MKTKLQRSSINSNHGGGGSSYLHSPLSFCIRSASNANSTACDTFSPRRLAMQIIDINDKKGDKIFNKIHGKSVVYRLSPIRKDREEDIVLYINVHREISAFFTIMDHFSNAFDISSLHRWLRFENFEKIPFLYSSWYMSIDNIVHRLMTQFEICNF